MACFKSLSVHGLAASSIIFTRIYIRQKLILYIIDPRTPTQLILWSHYWSLFWSITTNLGAATKDFAHLDAFINAMSLRDISYPSRLEFRIPKLSLQQSSRDCVSLTVDRIKTTPMRLLSRREARSPYKKYKDHLTDSKGGTHLRHVSLFREYNWGEICLQTTLESPTMSHQLLP